MTVTAPTGSLGLAKLHLRRSIADSPTFRAWTNSADQDQALNRVHIDDLPPPRPKADGDPQSDGATYTLDELRELRPFALVGIEGVSGITHESTARGEAAEYEVTGRLMVQFEQEIPEAVRERPGEIATRFENMIEAIMAEVLSVSGKAGYLEIDRVTVERIEVVHPDEESGGGYYQYVILSVEWSGI